MQKKILTISIIIFVLFIGGAALYYFFYLDPETLKITRESSEDVTVFPNDNARPPNGSIEESAPPQDNNTGVIDQTIPEEEGLSIKLVHSEPISGLAIYDLKTKSTTTKILRFVERATGHIFEATAPNWEVQRISNNTVPKIYNSLIQSKNHVYFQYLRGNVIETYGAELISTSTEIGPDRFNLKGSFMPRNIKSLVFYPTEDKILYLTIDGNTSRVISQTSNGQKRTELFSSDFLEWTPSVDAKSNIYLSTKASNDSFGYLYKLEGGSLSKILGPYKALETLASANGGLVLFSRKEQNGEISLNILDLKLNEERSAGIQAMASKCAFAKKSDLVFCAIPKKLSGALPDDWYKGHISFSDDLWQINLKNGSLRLITNLEALAKEPLDVEQLEISSDDRTILIKNKINQKLYLLSLGKI